MVKRLVIYILLSSFFFLSCTKTEDTKRYPVFGSDDLTDSRLIEKRSEVLADWVRKDIKDGALLLISDEIALKTVSGSDIAKLISVMHEKNLEAFKDGQGSLFNDSNYLDAARQLDIISRIFWVLPYSFFSDIPLAGAKIKDFLLDKGYFEENEVDRMKMDLGCLKGNLSGIELSICSPRTLPMIAEPVVINIDVSFFPIYAETLQLSKLGAMKRFYDEMAFRRLQTREVAISFGTEGGYSGALHRFIGDELFEGLRDSAIFRSDSPPELWKYRDFAENMLAGGEDVKVVEYLAEPLQEYPEDIPLRMLNLTAKVKSGTDGESFDELTDMCSADKYYCYGFIDIGDILVEKNTPDIAHRFYLKAFETLSDDPYAVRRYVRFLETSGREVEADSVKKKFGMDR